MVPSGSNTHAFDIDAEIETLEETGHDMADLPADLDDMAVEGAFAEDNAGQIRRVMPVNVSILTTPSIFNFFNIAHVLIKLSTIHVAKIEVLVDIVLSISQLYLSLY